MSIDNIVKNLLNTFSYSVALAAALLVPTITKADEAYKIFPERIFASHTVPPHVRCVDNGIGYGCLFMEPDPVNGYHLFLLNLDYEGNPIRARVEITPSGFEGISDFIADDTGYALIFKDSNGFELMNYDDFGNLIQGPISVNATSPKIAFHPSGVYGLFDTGPDSVNPLCEEVLFRIIDKNGNIVIGPLQLTSSDVPDCNWPNNRDFLSIIASDEGFFMGHMFEYQSTITGAIFYNIFAHRVSVDGARRGELLIDQTLHPEVMFIVGLNRDQPNNEYGCTTIKKSANAGFDILHTRIFVDPVDPRIWWIPGPASRVYESEVTDTEYISQDAESAFNGNYVGVVFRGGEMASPLQYPLYFLAFKQDGTLVHLPMVVTAHDNPGAPNSQSIIPVGKNFAITWYEDLADGPREDYDNLISLLGTEKQVSPPGSTHPIRIGKENGNLNVTWEEGGPGVTYNLYQGNLPPVAPFVYNHQPAVCHTLGAPGNLGELVETISNTSGSHYFLVSSSDGTTETSLGFASDGTERPNDNPCGP